jgi:hypothetical protein
LNEPGFRAYAFATVLVSVFLLGAIALLVSLAPVGDDEGKSMGEKWVVASHWIDAPPANIAKAGCSYPGCKLTDAFDVIAAGPGLVAVGVNGAGDITPDGDYLEADSAGIWTSSDGLTWKAVGDSGSGLADGLITSVAKAGEELVAVGKHGSRASAWISENGSEWTPVGGKVFDRNSEMDGVVAGGPGLVAVGSEGSNAVVWTSSTGGRSWKRGDVFDHSTMTAVATGEPGLVAVGYLSIPGSGENTAAIWKSSDGLTWTRVRDPADEFDRAEMWTVTAFGSGFVAAGASSDGSAVWISDDGRNWMRYYDPSLAGATISDVIAAGPGLVAVGEVEPEETNISSAAVWTSEEGRLWRLRSIRDYYGGLQAITTFGRKLVAVGYEQPGGEDSLIAAAWVSDK